MKIKNSHNGFDGSTLKIKQMAKTTSKDKIIEGLNSLELADLLEVAKKSAELVAAREKQENDNILQSQERLKLIHSGGK